MSKGITQNWMNSPAHLELLSKFINPNSMYFISQSYRSSDWNKALKENSLTAIQRFVKEGYLVRPSLDVLMDYKFKVPDLKKLCEERGLPVSGKKADLIKRLISADELGMQRAVNDLQVVVCSEKGKLLAQAYLEMREQEREEAERLSIDCLRKRDFVQAARVVAKFEANQIFSRGLGVDWNKEAIKPGDFDVQVPKIIFEEIPTVAKGVDQEKLERFRFAAALMHLWGNSARVGHLLEGIESISEKYDNYAFVMMLSSSAINKYNLKDYRDLARESGNNNYKIEILTCNDEHVCDTCRRLAEKKYPLFGDIPELPSPDCSHACRCLYGLDIGY